MRLDRRWLPWIAASLGSATLAWVCIGLFGPSAPGAAAGAAAVSSAHVSGSVAERGAVRAATRAEPAQPPDGPAAIPYERVARVMAMRPEGDDLFTLVDLVRDDPDPAVREAAVVALANAEDGRAIDALIAASRDPERRVALAAIELLSWTEDRSARAAIEAAARSGDAAVARAAARIVAQ